MWPRNIQRRSIWYAKALNHGVNKHRSCRVQAVTSTHHHNEIHVSYRCKAPSVGNRVLLLWSILRVKSTSWTNLASPVTWINSMWCQVTARIDISQRARQRRQTTCTCRNCWYATLHYQINWTATSLRFTRSSRSKEDLVLVTLRH